MAEADITSKKNAPQNGIKHRLNGKTNGFVETNGCLKVM